MKGGKASTVINWWLIVEVEVLGEIEESIDALLLTEDEVRLVRLPDFVPPSTFFWSTVLVVDIVEVDTCGLLTLELSRPVVEVDPVSGCPCAGIALDVLLED